MASIYKASLILSAVDKATSKINKVFGNVERRMQGVQKGADKFARQSASVARQAALVGSVAAAPLIFSGQKAIEFEDKMADVGKVLDLKTGSEGIMRVGKDVRELSIFLAKSQNDVAGLYASLAQGGVAESQLTDIAKTAGQMGVAFNMAAELAGTRFIKIQNALGTTTKQTKALTDTLNFLSDNQAAKASQLVDFFSAGGASATNMLKVMPQVSAAFGTMFISAGKSGEEAATIYERFTKGLLKGNNAASKVFSKAGGGLEGMLAVIQKGRKLKGTEQFKFFRAFGEYGPEVAQMANNYDKFQQVLGQAMDTQSQFGSVQKEFENRMSTTATKLAKARVQFDDLAITIGTQLLPAINPLVSKASAFLGRVAKWIEANPKLTKQLTKAVAIFAAVSFGIAGIAGVLSGIATIVSVAAAAFGGLTTVLGFLSTAVGVVNAFFLANPIVLIGMAIAAVVFLIYKNWGPIVEFFKGIWDKITKRFHFWVAVFKKAGSLLFDAGKGIIKNIWEGMKSMANKPVEVIKSIAKKVREYLPFSPAKRGAFRDLHRVKIIETIAGGMKPDPMVRAMQNVTGATMAPVGVASPSGGGGQIQINFSPVINMTGGDAGDKSKFMSMLREFEPELLQLVESAMNRRDRRKF